jgi:hypothetical protein
MRGSKPGERRGGRQKGAKNKRTKELERALAATAETVNTVLGDHAFLGDAHALLVAIYKDSRQPIELRVEAAKAAINYEKPRLSAVNAKIAGSLTLEELVSASMKRPPTIRL